MVNTIFHLSWNCERIVYQCDCEILLLFFLHGVKHEQLEGLNSKAGSLESSRLGVQRDFKQEILECDIKAMKPI